MWCINNNCYYRDKKMNICKRTDSNGTIGVCWMEESEGEY